MSRGPWKKTSTSKSIPSGVAPEALEVNEANEVNEVNPVTASPDLASVLQHIAAAQAQQATVMLELQSRLARQEARITTRADARPEGRTAVRPAEPQGVLDRDGNILVRRSFDSIDPFELPSEFLEAVAAEGYSVEWKGYSVFNQVQTTYMASLQANGHWRPVLNERLPGRYPGEPHEPICHGGLMLMERPAALTEQARREDNLRAANQVNMQHKNWGVNSKRRDYFDPDAPNAARFTLLRKTFEASDDAWRPELTVASDGEM